MQRGSGILLHLTSLPGAYGIGSMGREAYTFVDFLKKSGQKYWQILPLGPTGYGDSPYQSFSTFAGNPYLIDLPLLAEDGALTQADLIEAQLPEKSFVDYPELFQTRFSILKKAFQADKERLKPAISEFRVRQGFWIESYAMYMALKFDLEHAPLQDWEPALRLKTLDAITATYARLGEEIDFWVYVQYRFFEQWQALKTYANQNGIKIIGDIPIYVAEDSADAWANPDILLLDENKIPTHVAGCPPDYFAEKGQLWGNPLYNWDVLKEQNYEWWMNRIQNAFTLYDIVRIDHFRAFSAFYAIPYGREDAVIGEWRKGPGMNFFHALKERFGESLPIIAEDLGLLDDDVRTLLKDTDFPGMKVIQFGMTPGENSEYLPHNFTKNSVAYIGTHDNDTLCGWFEKEPEHVQKFSLAYMRTNRENYVQGFIETLMASPADVVIVTMQDLLQLGSETRMNTPAVLGGNWGWRLSSTEPLTDTLSETLRSLTETFSR
ncbi:MAG: 4-alpha-glucanotransferase [Clostridia bacterium]|nr:4-alpha-glucanotransferase [Clostridia bacterium]